MGRRGNPYDNAKAESFMKTLKCEHVYLNEYRNFAELVERVPAFLYPGLQHTEIALGTRLLAASDTPDTGTVSRLNTCPVRGVRSMAESLNDPGRAQQYENSIFPKRIFCDKIQQIANACDFVLSDCGDNCNTWYDRTVLPFEVPAKDSIVAMLS
jgi:hypothetical protein